jgi:hypothetical protein
MYAMRLLVYNHKTMNVAASPGGVDDRIVSHHHIRTVRMQRHLAVAGLACAAYGVTGPTMNSFVDLVALAAFTYVVLESFARAVDARLGYWWGWLYGEPEQSTWLDVAVDRIIRRLISARVGHSSATAGAIETADNVLRIRILPSGSEET